MELVTLDSSFNEDTLVENYESLIWAERYNKHGDFQLTSSDISGTILALPKETVVSLRESTVPMMIEDYKIEKKLREGPSITVTGRSYETVLERRASVNALPLASGRPGWVMTAEKESDAAYKIIRTVLGDIARSNGSGVALAAISPAVSSMDAIPELNLTLPADYSTGVTKTYEVKAGNLYTTAMELLSTNRRGIKAVRPISGEGTVDIEIYNGADITAMMVIDARFDQIDNAAYLLSLRGSTNVGYVYSPTGSQTVLKTAAPEPSGLDRRVLIVDESGNAAVNTSDIRRNRGLIELYKYNATALFDGQIAKQIASEYNVTYFLGDILKLTGEYASLSQNVRVAEFIRSSDKSGEKAYPTFEAID